jgi:hypothetical protein
MILYFQGSNSWTTPKHVWNVQGGGEGRNTVIKGPQSYDAGDNSVSKGDKESKEAVDWHLKWREEGGGGSNEEGNHRQKKNKECSR